MTTLRNSQFASIAVAAPPVAVGFRSSQMGSIAIASNPAAGGLRVSQAFIIAVTANGQHYQILGPSVGLGCWTPCGTLAYNGVK